MSTHRYRLCLTGLHEHKGQIKASSLRRVLDALIKMAESATRFLATGEGSRRGPRPGWLQASVDFTITGLNPGSTVLDIEAPHLGETAHEEFFKGESWPERPRLTIRHSVLLLLRSKKSKPVTPKETVSTAPSLMRF